MSSLSRAGSLRSSSAVLKDWVRALEAMQGLRDAPDVTLADRVAAMALATGDAPALIGAEGQLSYAGLAAQCNRVSRWALDQGMAKGDCVALLMPNRPDYVAIWLGLSQIGCVAALLNTNLSAEALLHCIRSAAASHVIVDADLLEQVRTVVPQVRAAWWGHGASDLPSFEAALAARSGEALSAGERRPPAAPDRALLIYTSGTTGLPKAANVTHARVMAWSAWFAGMMDTKPKDRLYNCLPLYHSVGGVVAVGSMLIAGGSVVLRRKFSARRFWDDVADHGCTVVQYIGELCRYLLQSPPHPRETDHRLRLCCGNGLRGDVWESFQARFAIPRILEFYAATEGNVSLYNGEGKPGAIGRVPPFLAHRFPVALIRCDPETGEVARNDAGCCIACAVDEPGEAIGPIGGSALRRFDGYTDASAADRKILHNVFADGDAWFRTGDLMRKDDAGYYYFVDRLGDTFRWKGENVSTTEVASVIAACPGVIDVVVYGVAVPGADGKAGMAALVVEEGFDLAAARSAWRERLPSYARPLFVRLCRTIETTGTFKLTKTALVREAVNDSADPVLFDNQQTLIPWP